MYKARLAPRHKGSHSRGSNGCALDDAIGPGRDQVGEGLASSRETVDASQDNGQRICARALHVPRSACWSLSGQPESRMSKRPVVYEVDWCGGTC